MRTPYYDWRYNGRIDHRINDKNTFSTQLFQSEQSRIERSGEFEPATVRRPTSPPTSSSSPTHRLNSVISPTVVNSVHLRLPILEQPDRRDQSVRAESAVPRIFRPEPIRTCRRKAISGNGSSRTISPSTTASTPSRSGFDYLWEPQLGGFFVTDPTPSIVVLRRSDHHSEQYRQVPAGLWPRRARCSRSPRPPPAIAYFDEHAKMFGLYLQDDWKVNRRLTVNLGLRWDKDFGLNGGDIQANSRAYLELKAISSPYAGELPHDDNKDFSPRVGTRLRSHRRRQARHPRSVMASITARRSRTSRCSWSSRPTRSLFTTVAYTNNVTPGTTTGTSTALPSGQLLQNWRFGVDPDSPAGTRRDAVAHRCDRIHDRPELPQSV